MFPRAVSFSGHSHIPLSTPQSSHKGWFTALSAGSYFLGRGKGGTAREVSVAAVFKDRIEVERRDLNTGFSENLSFNFGHACSHAAAKGLAAPPTRNPQLSTGAFTFVQWNIGHFAMGRAGDTKIPPAESAARQAQYEKLLAGIEADFIGLNEYSPKFDLAGKEARDSVFGGFGDFKAGPHRGFVCNALASRTAPLKSERIGEFANRKGVRYYIACETEIHGTPFVLVETHLDLSPREKRTAQIAELVRDFAACPRVIISGDFNVDEEGDFAPFAKAGFKMANFGAFGAFPTHRRRKVELTPCIDNVFVKGFDILGAWTADDSLVLSDHRLLLCRLRPELRVEGSPPVRISFSLKHQQEIP
jgi:endonuclease/exonuclease/phosphatase family metal-dependent hydrolase